MKKEVKDELKTVGNENVVLDSEKTTEKKSKKSATVKSDGKKSTKVKKATVATKTTKSGKVKKSTKPAKNSEDVDLEVKSQVEEKKSNAKRKKIVKETFFEDDAFAMEQKESKEKKLQQASTLRRINYVPIVIAAVCLIAVIAVIVAVKTKNLKLFEEKKFETVDDEELSSKLVKSIEEGIKETIMEEIEEEIVDPSIIRNVMPHFDTELYSEAAFLSHDIGLLKTVMDEIKKAQNNLEYNKSIDSKTKIILTANQHLLSRYLENYEEDIKKDYDRLGKMSYLSDNFKKNVVDEGKYWTTEYVMVTLFNDARDKGIYYDVPCSLYEKKLISKSGFDKLPVGGTAKLKLSTDVNDKVEENIITKISNNKLSYVDKQGKVIELTLVSHSDSQYKFLKEDGSEVLTLFMSDSIAILKNAMVGNGPMKDGVEGIARNYIDYPSGIPYEVFVKVEEIVDKTSTNAMYNSAPLISSNKQVWDKNGYIVSLINFEK